MTAGPTGPPRAAGLPAYINGAACGEALLPAVGAGDPMALRLGDFMGDLVVLLRLPGGVAGEPRAEAPDAQPWESTAVSAVVAARYTPGLCCIPAAAAAWKDVGCKETAT